jgi:A118 family predicted phage portal protein
MPLPSGGPWPPVPLDHVFDRLRIWSAWYGGDLDELASVYGGQTGMGDQTRTGFFASQQGGFKAGVRNALQRWFHGAPTPPTEQRTKLHVPIAGDIAATSADLLFSEPPHASVEDETTQKRLDELIDDGIHAALLEGAEVGAALGGVYMRVCWDEAISDRPWLAPVHADAAVPEFTYGKMTAVTFWRVLADDGKTVIRHLERHEKGAILHGVYAGDRDTLGRRIALTDMPETAALAEAITSQGDVIETGVDQLTAVYIPNMRPNRLWRTTPAAAYLGRSDYSGAEPFMDALDEVYSSLMRDIRLAKARLIVPEIYLESQGRGKSSVFQSEQEIFSPVNTMGDPQRLEITPAQFAIRVDEHLKTAQELTTKIVGAAGYSAQSFGVGDGMGNARPITATEISARERRSFITRDRKIVYWRPGLQQIIEVLLAIDASVFNSGVTPERPDLEFGSGVSEDPSTVAQTAQLLDAAQAASTDTKVRMVHPEWDDDQVAEEIAKIRDDQKQQLTNVPDPFGGMGSGGSGTPQGQQQQDPAAFGG